MNKTNSLLVVIALCIGCGTDAYERKSAESDDSGVLHWPKVTISKETTYFTEPLRPDGGVDYVAAFNKRLSEGVTPENNALIPLLQATGPKDIHKNIRKRYFQMLGIPELPEEGDYLIGFWDLPEYEEAEKQSGDEFFDQKIWGQHQDAVKAPWSKEDYPLWATVLERNEKLLNKVVEGLQRPRFYSPLVSEILGGAIFSAANSQLRQTMRLLPARATLRLHEGDVSGAWQDVLAQYRLQRLWSRRPFTKDRLVTDVYQHTSAVALSQYKGLSADQARECHRQIQSLPTMCTIGELYNNVERCSEIEGVLMLATADDAKEFSGNAKDFYRVEKSFIATVHPTIDTKLQQREEALRRLLADKDVDWSEVLRHFNAWYDRLADACDCSPTSKGLAMLNELETDTLRQALQTADLVLSKKPEALKNLNPKTKAQYVAKLVELPGEIWGCRIMVRSEQRRNIREQMTILAFALAGYRAEHNEEYPKTLAQLAPTYIDVIPKDTFNDGDFRYRAEDGGYLLYSVGQNGKDDGGFGPGNFPDSATEKQRKEWDDVSIRTPRDKSK